MGTTLTRSARAVWLLSAAALVIVVGGCGSGPGAGTVTSVAITCQSASVPINQQTTCSAVVNVADSTSSTSQSTSTAVTWQVNGASGGSLPSTGSIVTSVTDVQVGTYTAPPTVPSTNNGEVIITAIAPKDPSKSTATTTDIVTSNQVTITVGGGLGLAIAAPLTPSVPAGGTHLFQATLNGVPDPNATWSVSPINGGNAGSINTSSGFYTAPTFPPLGALVTITATDAAAGASPTVSTTAQIVYSDVTLHGSFAFSYTGNDPGGLLAAAGSFFADGEGHITSGVQDVSSFLTPVSEQQISSNSTYSVTPDGRGQVNLRVGGGSQVETFEFVLTTDQHADITRFDSSATGSGAMDQQTLGLSSLAAGPYVFSALGTDASFNPEGIAGEFSTPGDGTIGTAGSIVDVHDGASSSASVTSGGLTSASSYAFDATNAGTGRGILTLNTSAGALEFAFYLVNSARLNVVEIDGSSAYLAGAVFSAPPTGGFSVASLAAPDYVFAIGGMASLTANSTTTVGPYAAAGVFVSSGTGTVSSGVIDSNNQGTVTTNTALTTSCTYSVDPNSGRVDIHICPSGTGATASELVMYPTTLGTALALEIDKNALTTGTVYPQQSTPALASGGFALGLASQGIFHTTGARPISAQNVDGQFTTSPGLGGNLDVNFIHPFASDPINSTGSSLGPPAANGRSTFSIVATDPAVTYNLIYYLVGNNTALLVDQDKNNVLIGILERQF